MEQEQATPATGRLAELGSLTAEDFDPYVGQVFVVTNQLSPTTETHCSPQSSAGAGTEEVSIKLVEVTRLSLPVIADCRAQFSLLFESEREVMNATLGVAHPEMGSGTLFFARVMVPQENPTDEAKLYYESVFG